MAPAAQADSRRRNLGAALRHLHEAGPARQVDLAEEVGVNRSTAGALVDDLVACGLVVEQLAVSTGQRGRPSPVIGPDRDVVAVAVEVSSERARVQLVELGGATRARAELGTRPARIGPNRTATRLGAAIGDLLAGQPGTRPVGVALAVHGAVDLGGRVVFAPNLGWSGEVDLGGRIDAALVGLGLPSAALGNNADLGALAELRRGAGRGRRHFVHIAAERGIGGGLVVDGQLVRGANGLAGEVGHLKIPGSSAPCGCGQRGCWEAQLGQQALADRAGVGGVDELLDRARAGQRAAVRIVEEAAVALGRGLGTIVALLQPEAVVVGGHLPALVELAEDHVHAALAEACPPILAPGVAILPGQLGVDAAIVGAAELVFDRLFDDPAATARTERAS
jgi:predicted NBD/HSP70 family sugar kinase